MPKLKDGVTLLNLPLEAAEGRISLKDAYEEIFGSNAQADEALEQLKITKLTILESKRVLQNRIEAVN